MLKIFKHLRKKDWLLVTLGVAFIALSVWLELRIPGYMREITMLVQAPGTEVSEIWIQGLWMLGTAFMAMITTVIVGYLSGRVAAGFGRDLRVKVFGKVMSFGMAEVNGFSVPSLITRGTNDISMVEQIITIGFMTLVRSPIMAVWATTRVFDQGLEWAIATMVSVGVLLVTIVILIIFALPKFKIIPKLTDRLNLVAREHLSGIRVVKAYNAKAHEAEKFEKANHELMKTNRFAERMMASLWPVVGVVMQALPLAIYLIGAYLINNAIGEFDLEESGALFASMMVFAQYAIQVVMSFLMMSFMLVFLPQAIIAARRINEVLEKEETLTYPETSQSPTNTYTGVAVEFRGVNFKYPEADDYVLEDINFTIKDGETAAFIGATGSGKSTVLKLITRAYDRTSGEIAIAGKDIKVYTEKELTDKIGYTLQKATLLSGSIASNVAFGKKDATAHLSDIKEATDLAQAEEFISKLEQTYESEITQGATNVSGGQRQRLSIARTLFRKSDILIFDDSFSALDYKTDRKLREALKKNRRDVTKLIVAQRVSTIMDADKIIVLDEGRVVGVGTHQALLENCNVYYEIASSQLSKEELANG
ncbi:MAG: ABC transporter ATP-binding protein/permease [Turicibacter sp.]|nr:ABC transporter ATP-binding protein/permease [Turicibacter sp.]